MSLQFKLSQLMRWDFKKLIFVIGTLAITFAISVSASAALPNQRTDLKILLLSANDAEPTTAGWEAQFKSEGVPYDKIVLLPDHTPFTSKTFAGTTPEGDPHAKYQAVVIATGGLVDMNSEGNFVSAFSPEEWTALNNYEATYGIRQVTGFTFPNPGIGLNWPFASGDISGMVAGLTAQGATIFPNLKGPILIDQWTWGFLATPSDPANYTSLVDGDDGASLVGIYKDPNNGREEMVLSVDSNQRANGCGSCRLSTLPIDLCFVFGYWRVYHYNDAQKDGDDFWNRLSSYGSAGCCGNEFS